MSLRDNFAQRRQVRKGFSKKFSFASSASLRETIFSGGEGLGAKFRLHDEGHLAHAPLRRLPSRLPYFFGFGHAASPHVTVYWSRGKTQKFRIKTTPLYAVRQERSRQTQNLLRPAAPTPFYRSPRFPELSGVRYVCKVE
jgi:hypothetical protein